MMIVYDPLWETLQRKAISKYRLVHYHHIAKSTLDRMKKNKATSSVTINDLCRILDCQVSDIMKYVPDEPLPQD